MHSGRPQAPGAAIGLAWRLCAGVCCLCNLPVSAYAGTWNTRLLKAMEGQSMMTAKPTWVSRTLGGQRG